MSDTSQASLQARSAIGFGVVVRLLSIALGIMSAAIMARDGFNIRLSDYLEAVAAVYDDTLKDIALIVFDPAIKALFVKLRQWFAVDLHLFPHWKHIFVLMWLFLGSFARAFSLFDFSERAAFKARIWFFWIWGGVCAFAGGVLAGTVAPSEAGVFYWPVAAFVLFALGHAAWDAHPGAFSGAFTTILRWWLIRIGISAIIGVVVGYGFLVTISPGLLALTACVGSLAILLALLPQNWDYFFPGFQYRASLDILAILGGAAFIVWLGQALA